MIFEKAREYATERLADREQRKNKRRVVKIFITLLNKYDIPFKNSDIIVNEPALKRWRSDTLCKLVLPGSTEDASVEVRLNGIGGKTWTGETPRGEDAETTLSITREVGPNQYAVLSITQPNTGAPDEYEIWIQKKQGIGSSFPIQENRLKTRNSVNDYSGFFGVEVLPEELFIDVPATLKAFVNQPINPEDPTSLVPIVLEALRLD